MSAPAADRPLRRDAEQNRQRLLDAAADVFAEHGLEASVEEIARTAGVGMGTLYRRFPTKDALISALVHDVLTTMLKIAQEGTERPDGTGLEYFLEGASAYQAAHRGCLPRLWNDGIEHDLVQEIRRLIDAMLTQAKRHGRIRGDITNTDVTIALWAIRGIIETTQGLAPEAWQRHLDIYIAGLRPAADPLPDRELSREKLDELITERLAWGLGQHCAKPFLRSRRARSTAPDGVPSPWAPHQISADIVAAWTQAATISGVRSAAGTPRCCAANSWIIVRQAMKWGEELLCSSAVRLMIRIRSRVISGSVLPHDRRRRARRRPVRRRP
jgi:AcrR family transcriptional regulator